MSTYARIDEWLLENSRLSQILLYFDIGTLTKDTVFDIGAE